MYQIIINETDLQDKEGFESFLNKNLHSGKPEFKYRSCLYARCPYDHGRSTLRDKPLKKDKFVKEVVKMGV